MARFGVGIAYVDRDDHITMIACMIDAASKFEADGIGMAIAKKLHPPSEGFHSHAVATSQPDTVVTLEHVKRL